MSDDLDPQSDSFRPPDIPIEVHCIHCDQEYQSYLMQWVEETVDGRRTGFWCCPTPGCDGKGFGFDIFPTDPDWHDEERGFFCDECGEDDGDDDEEWDDLAESDEAGDLPDDVDFADDDSDTVGGNGNGNGKHLRPDKHEGFNEDDIPY